MGKPITEEVELIFDSPVKAAAFLRDIKGRVRFQVMAQVWLPTHEDRGFNGMAFLTVSRKDAIQVVLRAFSQTLADRGAKIKIRCTPPAYEGGHAYVAIY